MTHILPVYLFFEICRRAWTVPRIRQSIYAAGLSEEKVANQACADAKSFCTLPTMSGYERRADPASRGRGRDRYGTTEDESVSESYRRPPSGHEEVPQDESAGVFRETSYEDEDDDGSEAFEMSLSELLYSTSSFYAIVIPGESSIRIDGLLAMLSFSVFQARLTFYFCHGWFQLRLQ